MNSPGDRPILVALEGGACTPAEVLEDVRDYVRQQAMRLPGSNEWRDALFGIARDLSYSLELSAAAQTQLDQQG